MTDIKPSRETQTCLSTWTVSSGKCISCFLPARFDRVLTLVEATFIRSAKNAVSSSESRGYRITMTDGELTLRSIAVCTPLDRLPEKLQTIIALSEKEWWRRHPPLRTAATRSTLRWIIHTEIGNKNIEASKMCQYCDCNAMSPLQIEFSERHWFYYGSVLLVTLNGIWTARHPLHVLGTSIHQYKKVLKQLKIHQQSAVGGVLWWRVPCCLVIKPAILEENNKIAQIFYSLQHADSTVLGQWNQHLTFIIHV